MPAFDQTSPDELIDYLAGEPLNVMAAVTARTLWFYAGRIDPNTIDPGNQALRDLKRLEINGERLQKLFERVCRGSYSDILTLLRAESFAILPPADLFKAIDDGEAHQLDLRELLAQVKSRLPDFNRESG